MRPWRCRPWGSGRSRVARAPAGRWKPSITAASSMRRGPRRASSGRSWPGGCGCPGGGSDAPRRRGRLIPAIGSSSADAAARVPRARPSTSTAPDAAATAAACGWYSRPRAWSVLRRFDTMDATPGTVPIPGAHQVNRRRRSVNHAVAALGTKFLLKSYVAAQHGPGDHPAGRLKRSDKDEVTSSILVSPTQIPWQRRGVGDAGRPRRTGQPS